MRKELEIGEDSELQSHQKDKEELQKLEDQKAQLGHEGASEAAQETPAEESPLQEEQNPEIAKEESQNAELAKNTKERQEKLGETIEALQKNSTILFGILVTLQAQGEPSPIGLLDQASLVMIPMQMEFLNKAGMLTLDKAKEMITGFKKVIEGRTKPAPSSENGGNGSETAAMLAERQFGALSGNVKTIEEMLSGKNEKGEAAGDPADLFKKENEHSPVPLAHQEKTESTAEPAPTPEPVAEPRTPQGPESVPRSA